MFWKIVCDSHQTLVPYKNLIGGVVYFIVGGAQWNLFKYLMQCLLFALGLNIFKDYPRDNLAQL